MCDFQSDVNSLRGLFCGKSELKKMSDISGIKDVRKSGDDRGEKNSVSGGVVDEGGVRKVGIAAEDLLHGDGEHCNVLPCSSRTYATTDCLMAEEEKEKGEDDTVHLMKMDANDNQNNDDIRICDSHSPISISSSATPLHNIRSLENTCNSTSEPNINNANKIISRTGKIWYETNDINSLEINRTNTNKHVRKNRKVRTRTSQHSFDIASAEEAEEEAAYRLSIRCEVAMWKYQWELASFQAARVARILESESS